MKKLWLKLKSLLSNLKRKNLNPSQTTNEASIQQSNATYQLLIEIKGVNHEVFTSKNNKLFIYKVSSDTDKLYKYYLTPSQISKVKSSNDNPSVALTNMMLNDFYYTLNKDE